jgi:RNA polymerase sigma-70 factor (ECF subfamily)
MQDESSELARRAIAGERRALEELWGRHRRWLATVILAHRPRRAGGPHAETDDLLQDVALAVTRNIGKLRDPQRLRPWLRAVALNTIRTWGRRARGVAATSNGHLAFDERPDQAAGSASAAADARRMLHLIESLPLRYREPLLLHALRDLPVRAIAEILGLPVKTVETRLWRGRRLLWDAMMPGDAHVPEAAVARPEPGEGVTPCTTPQAILPTC